MLCIPSSRTTFPARKRRGEFLQVAHLRHGAVDRSLMEFPGWKEPQEEQQGRKDASSSSLAPPEHPGVPKQCGTEIKEIILVDKPQTGAPRASPDSVLG